MEATQNFFTDDEYIDLLVLIEEKKILDAVRFFREKTGLNLQSAAYKIKDIAKKELNISILEHI